MNHVLVVEDDKEIREGVEIYLKSQGYEVFQAADGVEGLEVIEKEDIHLAIVDINRKMLAEMAVNDAQGFAALAELAKSKVA